MNHSTTPKETPRSRQICLQERIKGITPKNKGKGLNLKQAAKILKVSPATLKKWHRDGIASATVKGGNYITLSFSKTEIERLKKLDRWCSWG